MEKFRITLYLSWLIFIFIILNEIIDWFENGYRKEKDGRIKNVIKNKTTRLIDKIMNTH